VAHPENINRFNVVNELLANGSVLLNPPNYLYVEENKDKR